MSDLLELKRKKLRLLEQETARRELLPHLYGLKMYKWARKYSDAKFCKARYLCAANQIGKSSTQIRDRITIATTPSLWPKLWPAQYKLNKDMTPFSWYLYPNFDTVTSEVEDKWIPQFLPRGKMKDDPVFGWRIFKENKKLKAIIFNNGYKIYFKTYSQNVVDLQSGTPFAIDADEELPMDLKPELDARLYSSDGQFSMVFTATLGQDYWRDVIEGKGVEEREKDAFKIQVSMYDCLEYEDGSSTPWTEERIERIKLKCKNSAEVERRIYGKFVVDTGLVYPTFDRARHFVRPNINNPKILPSGWFVYGGVDIGTGGEDNHPAAMVILGCSPDYKKVRVLKCRRMDKIETTAGDILNAYMQLLGDWKPISQCYDWAARDFHTIATRCGIPFKKAKKNHEVGEMVLNTAFKLDMLKVYNRDEDSLKLARELEGLRVGANKRTAKDDLIDALRYAMMSIPVDWEVIVNTNTKTKYAIQHGAVRGKNGTIERERPEDFYKENYVKRYFSKEDNEELKHWAGEFESY